MLSGDNGILQKATQSKEKTERAEVVENAKLDVLAQIAENKGENISKDQLKTILNKYFEDIDALVLPDDISNSDIKLNAKQQYGSYHNIALVDIYNGKFTITESDTIYGLQTKNGNKVFITEDGEEFVYFDSPSDLENISEYPDKWCLPSPNDNGEYECRHYLTAKSVIDVYDVNGVFIRTDSFTGDDAF